jgi:hypothetical protein
MSKYILNKNQQDSQSGKNYEVHNEDSNCSKLPNLENRISLGYHQNCESAIRKAKETRPEWKYDIDGCFYCAKDCHTE